MSTVEEKRMGGVVITKPMLWKKFDSNSVICRAAFYKDEESGYTAIATNLPGVVSEGDTLKEAVNNIREAFELAIESYRESQMPIPWGSHVDLPEDKPTFEFHFVVNVNG